MNVLFLLFLFAAFRPASAELHFQEFGSCILGADYTFIDFQTSQNSLVTIQSTTANPTNYSIYYCPFYESPIQLHILSNQLSPKVRIPSKSNLDNPRLIVFTRTKADLYNIYNNGPNLTLDFTSFPFLNISQSCFGQTINQVLVFSDFYNLGFYSAAYFDTSLSLSPITVRNTTVARTTPLDSMVCRNGIAYACLFNQILRFSINSSLIILGSYLIPSAPLLNLDLHVTQFGLFYNYGNTINIINEENNSIVHSFTFQESIISLRVMDRTYLVFSTSSTLRQYDYNLGQIIYSQVTPYITSRLFSSGNILLVVEDMTTQYLKNTYSLMNYSPKYPCTNCAGCLPGYFTTTPPPYDPQLSYDCVKQVAPNSTSNSTTSNSTTDNSTSNSTTSNSITENQITSSNISQNQSATDYLNSEVYEFNINLLKILSTTLIISSMKFSPQFLISLLIVFDDIYRYSYHTFKYPHSAYFFINGTSIVFEDKLDPWMFKLVGFFNQSIDYATQNNQRYIQYLGMSSLQNSDVFFTKSFLYICRNSLLLVLLIFSVIKIVNLALFPLRNKFKCLKIVYRHVKNSCLLIVFFSSLIQSNITQYAFDFGIQIQIPFNHSFIDKVNLAICVSVSFIILEYVFIYYPLLYCTTSYKKLRMLLMHCKYEVNSFFYQPALMLIRSVVRAFLHSYFIKYYDLQILSLSISNFLSVGLCLKMRNAFHNRIVFILYTLYMSFFAVFDLFFYLQAKSLVSSFVNRELFGLVCLSCAVCICLLISLKDFLSLIYQIFQFLKKFVKGKTGKVVKQVQPTKSFFNNNLIPVDLKLKQPDVSRHKKVTIINVVDNTFQQDNKHFKNEKKEIRQGILNNKMKNRKQKNPTIIKLLLKMVKPDQTKKATAIKK